MKNLPILFLLFLLAACVPAVTESPVTIDMPAPTNTPVPTATATMPPSPTPTESPEQEAARIAQNILNGESVNLNGLTEQQRSAVMEVLKENQTVLAQQVLDGKLSLADITENWTFEQKMALAEISYDKNQPNIFPTLIEYAENEQGDKVEGTLHYFDGKKWNELEPMLGLNGKQIPWGESYMTGTTEGEMKLSDMFGNAAGVEWDKVFDGQVKAMSQLKEKSKVEEILNFNADNAQLLFVQMYPEKKSEFIRLGKKLGFYETPVKIVIEKEGIIYVVQTNMNMGGRIYVYNSDSERVVNYSATDFHDAINLNSQRLVYQNGFVGIPTHDMTVHFLIGALNNRDELSANELEYLNGNLESNWSETITELKIDENDSIPVRHFIFAP